MSSRCGGSVSRAYSPEYDEALAALQSLQHELEDRNQSAAGSLAEGLDETLTLHRLGVYGVLGRSLKTTNGLESINALIEERLRRSITGRTQVNASAGSPRRSWRIRCQARPRPRTSSRPWPPNRPARPRGGRAARVGRRPKTSSRPWPPNRRSASWRTFSGSACWATSGAAEKDRFPSQPHQTAPRLLFGRRPTSGTRAVFKHGPFFIYASPGGWPPPPPLP